MIVSHPYSYSKVTGCQHVAKNNHWIYMVLLIVKLINGSGKVYNYFWNQTWKVFFFLKLKDVGSSLQALTASTHKTTNLYKCSNGNWKTLNNLQMKLINKFKLIFFHSRKNFQFMRMPELISFSSETFKAEETSLVAQVLYKYGMSNLYVNKSK